MRLHLALSYPSAVGGGRHLAEALALYLVVSAGGAPRGREGTMYVGREDMLEAMGMLLYGALPGVVHGRSGMSVPAREEAGMSEDGIEVHGAVAGTMRHAQGGGMGFPSLGQATGLALSLAERDPAHTGHASAALAKRGLRLRILMSYHYYKDENLDELIGKYFAGRAPDIFLDSGAFSARSLGAEIDLADYMAYIRRWAHHLTTYANLDVIGSAEGTRANQLAMEAEGLSPLPVFHLGEPWDALDWMLERYPYIALGGMVGANRTVLGKWIAACFKRAEGRAVFHGFGLTTWSLLKDFRWYSVDSSSWGQGFRYGQLPIFDPRHGRFRKASLGDPKSCYAVAHLFRDMGFDPADFADRERNDRAKVCAVSALSYMMAERWLRKRWGEVVIPGREVESGIHLVVTPKEGGSKHPRMGTLGEVAAMTDTAPGVNIHLVEHSLDDGEVGHASRASEALGLSRRKAEEGKA